MNQREKEAQQMWKMITGREAHDNDIHSKRDGFGIGELGRAPATDIEAELEAERLQPKPKAELVRCKCGHSVPSILVMSTSQGTSCPDCYDRMEN